MKFGILTTTSGRKSVGPAKTANSFSILDLSDRENRNAGLLRFREPGSPVPPRALPRLQVWYILSGEIYIEGKLVKPGLGGVSPGSAFLESRTPHTPRVARWWSFNTRAQRPANARSTRTASIRTREFPWKKSASTFSWGAPPSEELRDQSTARPLPRRFRECRPRIFSSFVAFEIVSAAAPSPALR